MATTTFSTAARNAKASAVAALANGGTARLRNGSTVIGTVPLAATAFGAPSNGVVTLRGGDGSNPVGPANPLTGTGAPGAGAGTNCDNIQILAANSDVIFEGDAGAAGSGDGGSDPVFVLINPNIAEDQPIAITSGTYTEPETVVTGIP